MLVCTLGELILDVIVRLEQPLAGNLLAQLPGVKKRVIAGVLIISLGDFQRTLQRVLHLDIEPTLEGAGNKPN